MAEALPEKLQWMGEHGSDAFWRIADTTGDEALANELNVTTDEIDRLRSKPIHERRDALAANATFLLLDRHPDELRQVSEKFAAQRRQAEGTPGGSVVSAAIDKAQGVMFPRIVDEIQETAPSQGLLGRAGLEWNEKSARAKFLKENGRRPNHRQLELFTEVAASLFLEWYGATRPVSKERVEPIMDLLGWFFEPSLLPRAQKRIRDRLKGQLPPVARQRP